MFGCSRRHDGNTMLQGSAFLSLHNGGFEVSHKAIHVSNFSAQADLHFVRRFHFPGQLLKITLNILSPPCFVQGSGVAPQFPITLHEVSKISLFRQVLGGFHTGHSAADHQRVLVDVEYGLR